MRGEKEKGMKIGIIGPGALGCLFASRLFLAATRQDNVLLIDHDPQRATILNDQGICYELDGNLQRLAIPIVADPAVVGSCDILFCCVKSYHLKHCLQLFSPLLSPNTLFIFLQNGISHLNYVKSPFPCISIFGSSSEGSNMVCPGHIRHAGKGHSYLGFTSSQDPVITNHLQRVCDLLCKGSIETTISSDILSQIWAKLFVNVGINALTAIHNLPNGELLASDSILKNLKQLLREAIAVAQASGIKIQRDPIAETLAVCTKTASNISSMLQDVRMLRPTEINAINGAISRIGQEYGVATPCNDAVTKQVLYLEKEYNAYSNR